ADVIFAELACGIAEAPKQAADRGVELAHSHWGAWKANFGQAGANAMLTGQKGRTTGGTRLLAIVMQKSHSLVSNAIDVRRVIPHQPVAITAEVGNADVVAKDDEDVRLRCRLCQHRRRRQCK